MEEDEGRGEVQEAERRNAETVVMERVLVDGLLTRTDRNSRLER